MHVDESWIILPRGGTTAEAAFNHHLAVVGTAHKMTPHDMPQLSGVAEHLNAQAHLCTCTQDWPAKVAMGRGVATCDVLEESDCDAHS